MWRIYTLVVCTFLSVSLGSTPVMAETGWQQIAATDPFVDRNGVARQPSCSGGPKLTPTGGMVPANTDFSFFFNEGDSSKLVIALDGGGACWDANTCIGSALAGTPIYNLEVDETIAMVEQIGGLGDESNPGNPLRGYTKVFIPYCSGDIHWGSKDTVYSFPTPAGMIDWPIHHRGFDNVVAVLEWLDNYYKTTVGSAPDKVVITGLSAGGYGTLLALPAVKAMLPRRSRTYLLADSANGVISEDFYERALGGYAVSGGVWGVEKNLPDFLLGAFTSGPDGLAAATYTTLAWRYPFTRFGQYTRAWDATQVFYYNVSKQLDYPERWSDPAYLIPTALEWSLKARTAMHISALAPNYRFYIAEGNAHTVLADDGFYSEHSGEGVYLSDWVDDMVNQRGFWRVSRHNTDWRNVTCAPNCLTPWLTGP